MSCQRLTSDRFSVAATMTRKTARIKLARSAMTTAQTTSARRRNTESRFTSPKRRPIMSDVCNDRIPLHASFTPTRPLLTRIRLPSTCAGVPSSIAVSAATRATTRINPWITGVSRAVGHGTAMKINATGNAKWRSHALPPAPHRSKSVSVTTAKAWIQASNRHSGFAISKRRSGSSKRSAVRPTTPARIR